jgi:hypothetical protein
MLCLMKTLNSTNVERNTKMKKNELEDIISNLLEDNSFEDVLEKFDLTPTEVFVLLYNQGLIDEEVLKSINDAYEF